MLALVLVQPLDLGVKHGGGIYRISRVFQDVLSESHFDVILSLAPRSATPLMCLLPTPEGAMGAGTCAKTCVRALSRGMLELAQLENKARFKNFTDNTRDFNQALTEGTFLFTMH
jgi:hypothetical protein